MWVCAADIELSRYGDFLVKRSRRAVRAVGLIPTFQPGKNLTLPSPWSVTAPAGEGCSSSADAWETAADALVVSDDDQDMRKQAWMLVAVLVAPFAAAQALTIERFVELQDDPGALREAVEHMSDEDLAALVCRLTYA